MLIAAQSAPRASGNRHPSASRPPQPRVMPATSAARRSSAKPNVTSTLSLAQSRVWQNQTARLTLAQAFARSTIFNWRTMLLQTLRDTEQHPLAEYQGLGLLSLMSDVGHANHQTALARLLEQGLAPSREMLREHLITLLLEHTQGMLPPRAVDMWVIVAKEVVASETASRAAQVGLDPAQGFLHTSSQGFAQDLAQPLCPVLVESTLCHLLRTNQIEEGDFTLHGTHCLLSEAGRLKLHSEVAARWQTVGSLGKSISQLLDEHLQSLVQYFIGEIDVFTSCLLITS